MKNNQVGLLEIKFLLIEINSLPRLSKWKEYWETGRDI